MEDVQGVLGKKKGLPCDITPGQRERNDGVAMVLWFRDGFGEPFYSFDVRSRQFSQARLWSSPTIFGPRVFFRAATNPATLVINDIKLSDEGIYRCRVDFRNSPTRNSKVNFTVIIPPEKPIIYDEKRRDKTGLLDPYNEGSDVNLICEVSGGRPKPKVVWFLENTLIDDSYEVRDDGIVVNHLHFPNIGRQHLKARLICQASNTILTPPSSKVVILDINLKPTSVNILTKEKQYSADKRYDIECRTSGSRPEAVITWWKGSRPIKRLAKNFPEQDNQTMSILTLVPTIEDDGKYLTCRAENPSIPDSALENKWRLNVHYMPVVTLKMGSSLNPEDIKEGDDVYFECNVRANPKAYKLSWFHDVTEIHHNVSAGIILSDHSLVLQSVTKATAGKFICRATNTEGRGTSNPVVLDVRYSPICKQEKEELYGALKQETVLLKCELDANPNIVTFHWTFNNSGDQTEVPATRFTSEHATSRLNYTPISDMDYGTLSCWGENAIGHQRSPCVFQVVTAGRPYPLLNCTVINQSSNALEVECVESFDGGLPQSFIMEVLELPSLESKLNVTTHKAPPTFYAEGLDATASYRILMYAVNAKGRSDPAVIDAVTFKGVAKFTGQASMTMSPLFMGLLGTAGILATGVCLVFAALCRKHYTKPCHRSEGVTKHIPMEAVMATDDLVDSPVTDHRGSANLEPLFADSLKNIVEITDPDIIRNQYERKSSQTFTKTYQETDSRVAEDENDEEFRFLAKENVQSPNKNIYKSLQRSVRTPSTIQPSLAQKYRGHEIVTTSNRIQESCI
ncbi:titin isoform X2 [Agrilus planipennis]|uniref:Titin isoform X2 n=1 Tax=Agrilus planipennis TaxID=224129 RepID=A0A1W4WRT9_AGRPL|nr:titin isoform X2 [Agrilus planipennis]